MDTKVQSQLDSPQYFKLDPIKVKILVPGSQACEYSVSWSLRHCVVMLTSHPFALSVTMSNS